MKHFKLTIGLVWLVVGVLIYPHLTSIRLVRDLSIPRKFFDIPSDAKLLDYLSSIKMAIEWIEENQPYLSAQERIELIREGFSHNLDINIKEGLYSTLELNVKDRHLFISPITARVVFPEQTPLPPIDEVKDDLLDGWIILYDKDRNEIKRFQKEKGGISRTEYEELKNGYIRVISSGTGAASAGSDIIAHFKNYPRQIFQIHKADGFITGVWIFDEETRMLDDKEYTLVYMEDKLVFSAINLSKEKFEEFKANYGKFRIDKRTNRRGSLKFWKEGWVKTSQPYMFTKSYFEDKRKDKILVYDDWGELFERREFIYHKDILEPIAIDIYDAEGKLKRTIGFVFVFRDGKWEKISDEEEIKSLDGKILKRTDQHGRLSFGKRSWWQKLPPLSITESMIKQGKVVITWIYDKDGNLMRDKTREMRMVFNFDKSKLLEVYPRILAETISPYRKVRIRTRLDGNGRLNIFSENPLYRYPKKYANCVIELYIEDGREKFMIKSYIYDLRKKGDILEEGKVLEIREFVLEDGKVVKVYVYDAKGHLIQTIEK